jgi:hypothetical protein
MKVRIAIAVLGIDLVLSGEGRSAALHAEQLEMLKDGHDPSSRAAFIPSGDWTPLGLIDL